MNRSHRIVTLLLFPVSFASAADFVQVRTFPTHSRMIIKIDESVSTELKNTKTGFELLLHGVTLAELRANSGDDQKGGAGYQRLNDPRLEGIHIKDGQGEIKIQGKWKFPTGALTLARPVMELFDYRDKSPPEYIVDFWVKESPTLQQVEGKLKQDAYLAERKKVHALSEKKQARRLASLKQEEAYLSSMQVCEIPMSAENDLFLKFNTIHQKVDFSRWISLTTPDSNFSYYRTLKKTRDAKYVRLALDLYKRGSWGLVVRTLDFLNKEYPNSDYSKEMRFLRANTYLKLGLDRQAIDILQKIMSEYDKEEKGSSVALYAAMYLAGKFINDHLTLAAMDNFLWLIQNYSEYENVAVFHLGVAENLYELKQTERAAKEYQWVIENALTDKMKAEAAYRLGDLYMVRFQYEEAIASYSIALRDYPSEAHSFPSFFINRGEALYQLGQFEIAKQVFHEVIDHYAGLPEGWRATFRLGEIVAKGTLDPEKIKESRSWFYDTINRYPLSPGATLARIRLLPCGDHAGMDSYASENFFTNVAVNFDGGGAVVLKDYNDFRALAHIRTLATLGPEEQLGKVAFQELQNVKSPLARKKIILVATESVQRKIMKLISEGKQYDALSFYTLMSPLIDKDVESERVDYLLALSQSASNLGLGAFGEKLLKIYQDKLEHLKRRPNRVLAQAPLPDNQDDLELEIKQAEEYFSAAKAGWIVGSKDQAGLALIREKLSHISAESKYFYEKEIILGLIEERQGNLKAALVHAASAHLQKPSVRVTAWLASLAKSVADTKDALELYKIVENCLLDSKGHELINEPIESNLGVPPVPHLVDVVFLEGELLEKNEKWAEASAKYSQAMSSGLGGNQLVFRYAWSLIKGGEAGAKEKALEVLEKLSTSETKNDKEEFWKKMALTTLEGEKSKAKVD